MITLHEPYPALGKAIGFPALYFKREDTHPYGSHKGRSIPVMIDYHRESGKDRFAITGSGNAALAAALHVQKLDSDGGVRSAVEGPLELDIFVGQHAAKHKTDKLKKLAQESGGRIRLSVKERPLQALMQAVQEGAQSLRQSTDDTALLGYKELAEELNEIVGLGAVFIGASSGTTAQALAQFFASSPEHREARVSQTIPPTKAVKKGLTKQVQVHIVQTSSCHPMSDAFEGYDGPDEPSVADAIIDKTAVRKPALVPLIERSGGHGWTVSNDDIAAAQELAKKHTGLSISTNSALSVAGAMQAAYRGWEIDGAVVCILGGD